MAQETPDPRMAALAEIAENFELADVYVFGSRAAEFVQHADSSESDRPPAIEPDLDVGVRPIMGRRLSARRRADLVVALEDLFDVPRVDLVIVPEAPPFLALAVISGELIFCRDSTDQAEYELYVLRRAGDLAPFEQERRAHILGEA